MLAPLARRSTDRRFSLSGDLASATLMLDGAGSFQLTADAKGKVIDAWTSRWRLRYRAQAGRSTFSR